MKVESFRLWGVLQDFIVENKDNFKETEQEDLAPISNIIKKNYDLSRRKMLSKTFNKNND